MLAEKRLEIRPCSGGEVFHVERWRHGRFPI
jgi:hypothetical protein